MPTILVDRDVFFQKLGKKYEHEEIENFCFSFGLEIDDVIWENEKCTYKFDLPANRPDLLSVEGLCLSLRAFLDIEKYPKFSLKPKKPEERNKIVVKSKVGTVRPYVLGAILRNVTFDENSYKSFIDLQEKLHQNICRKRKLVAIGTHDLDKICGPFTYDALPPCEIKFAPLNKTEILNGIEIMNLYENHQQLKQYLDIIRFSPLYPVITDSNKIVLSMPPIINGDHSKITTDTKNIFIECTALDIRKAENVLNTLVSAFSEYAADKYTIEPVLVEYESDCSVYSGQSHIYPNVENQMFEVDLSYLSRVTNIKNLDKTLVFQLLDKMGLNSQAKNENTLNVYVPMNRSDIMHACDIAEDCAIAYGYSSISEVEFDCVEEYPINSLSEHIRKFLALCGFHEALNWSLCSIKECYDFLNRNNTFSEENEELNLSTKASRESMNMSNKTDIFKYYNSLMTPIQIGNPKTTEFEIVRTSLIAGLLKSLHANQHKQMPIKLFEIGDVMFLNESLEFRSENKRYVAVAYGNKHCSGLEEIHGLLDSFMETFSFYADYTIAEMKEKEKIVKFLKTYKLVPSNHKMFLSNRQVDIVIEDENLIIGIMGVIHPSVLNCFNLNFPVSVFELNIEGLLKWLPATFLFD